MEKKLTVLCITSENTTTSIPLELACYMQQWDTIDMRIATYYGKVHGEPKLKLSDKDTDLNIPKKKLLLGYRKIYRLIKEIKPDVVHAHHNISALLSIVAAKRNKVKLIMKTEHNDHRFLKWHQKIINIPILLMSDVVICNSVSTKNSFYPWEKFIAGKKTMAIYNGINVNKILKYSGAASRNEIRKKYNVSKDERLFFCAARLIKQKNFENLIKAFAAATSEKNNIRLLIAGVGNLYESLVALKSGLDKFDKIQFLGILDREDVFKLMNASDFFTVVSLWEGFCNAAVEAMVTGCPMVYSNIVTLREVIGNEAGRFVDPKNVDDIKRIIVEMAAMSDNELSAFSTKSHNRAVELYSIENTATQYFTQYQKGI